MSTGPADTETLVVVPTEATGPTGPTGVNFYTFNPPVADPHAYGLVWNNAGVLTVSAG